VFSVLSLAFLFDSQQKEKDRTQHRAHRDKSTEKQLTVDTSQLTENKIREIGGQNGEAMRAAVERGLP